MLNHASFLEKKKMCICSQMNQDFRRNTVMLPEDVGLSKRQWLWKGSVYCIV